MANEPERKPGAGSAPYLVANAKDWIDSYSKDAKRRNRNPEVNVTDERARAGFVVVVVTGVSLTPSEATALHGYLKRECIAAGIRLCLQFIGHIDEDVLT